MVFVGVWGSHTTYNMTVQQQMPGGKVKKNKIQKKNNEKSIAAAE